MLPHTVFAAFRDDLEDTNGSSGSVLEILLLSELALKFPIRFGWSRPRTRIFWTDFVVLPTRAGGNRIILD